MPSIQCKIMATLDAGAWRSPSREHVEPWKTRWGDDYLGCDLSAEAAAANMLVSRYCLRGSAVPESLFLSRIPKLKEASFGAESVVTWSCDTKSTRRPCTKRCRGHCTPFSTPASSFLPPQPSPSHPLAGWSASSSFSDSLII